MLEFPPPLFLTRPLAVQLTLAILLPILGGVTAGVLLGLSGPAYLIFSAVTVLAGIGAGYEHPDAGEGALRGIGGGVLFGSFILATAAIIGTRAKADLPHPAGILVAVTTILGILLGAWGGSLRGRRERAETAAATSAAAAR